MMTVTITTAVKLSAKQLDSIHKAVAKKHGSDLNMVEVVDPSVIGGIRIMIGSTMLDHTVAGKFAQLRTQLVHQS